MGRAAALARQHGPETSWVVGGSGTDLGDRSRRRDWSSRQSPRRRSIRPHRSLWSFTYRPANANDRSPRDPGMSSSPGSAGQRDQDGQAGCPQPETGPPHRFPGPCNAAIAEGFGTKRGMGRSVSPTRPAETRPLHQRVRVDNGSRPWLRSRGDAVAAFTDRSAAPFELERKDWPLPPCWPSGGRPASRHRERRMAPPQACRDHGRRDHACRESEAIGKCAAA